MARPSLDQLKIVGLAGRAASGASYGLPEAVADGLLADLATRCADAGAAPAEVARLAALDLCAGLVAFGGVRTLGETHPDGSCEKRQVYRSGQSAHCRCKAFDC
jgi:hypothetical protein